MGECNAHGEEEVRLKGETEGVVWRRRGRIVYKCRYRQLSNLTSIYIR